MTIKCVDCGKEFNISESEKAWYESKGFKLPKRCPSCREIKRKRNNTESR